MMAPTVADTMVQYTLIRGFHVLWNPTCLVLIRVEDVVDVINHSINNHFYCSVSMCDAVVMALDQLHLLAFMMTFDAVPLVFVSSIVVSCLVPGGKAGREADIGPKCGVIPNFKRSLRDAP